MNRSIEKELNSKKDTAQISGGISPDESISDRRRFDEFIVSLSARCTDSSSEGLALEIEKVLKDVTEHFQVDRVVLWDFLHNGLEANLIHFHSEAYAQPVAKMFVHNDLPYIMDTLRKQKAVTVSCIDDLPASAEIDRQSIRKHGVKSLLAIPLFVGRILRGALSFSFIRSEHRWSYWEIIQAQRVGEIIANSLDRKWSYQMLRERLRFETLISDLSARFAGLPGDRIAHEIDYVLEEIRIFFDADQCGLFECDIENGLAYLKHRVYGEGVDPAPLTIEYRKLFPWSYDKILRGEVKILNSIDDYPPEADVDRCSFPLFGVKSVIDVPISTGGVFRYNLCIACSRTERVWPLEYVPRIKLLGETLVSAIARKDSFEAQQQAEEELKRAQTEIKELNKKLVTENVYLRQEVSQQKVFNNFIGQSDVMQYVFFRIHQVASTNSTVLITGETGTGKGMVARAIHQESSRRNRLMVTVNCAALPANLIESELFGREKGAFTGAHTAQIGRFELADRGTIFLDEIGELPLELQAKLLRVIEDGEFERLGSPRSSKVDVRIIASTNRNLPKEIHEGRFREDLFYRLNVFPITIPPMRQRKEDVPMLVRYFVEKHGNRMGKQIAPVSLEVMDTLQKYPWPGNVRELENIIERSVIGTTGNVLRLADLVPHAGHQNNTEEHTVEDIAFTSETPIGVTTSQSLLHIERNHILRSLHETGWRIEGVNGAAQVLGLNPSTLRSRMKKLGIQKTINY